ncbi:beige/BEACH domain-containing protein [Loa loa]|uniref:Putative neurobeachin homolog n=1 Tax=Loa loa TaxID=7209 RepID=A0A1S0UMF6_LOALO|nr:beige/BEACH domain-containing protein [Loa loa]EJD76568.1 beige/BEACH domain-containing protein [Loa loa]
MDNFIDQCAEIIAKQQRNFDKRTVTPMPNAFLLSLQNRISSFQEAKFIYLLQTLSSICPFLLAQDVEIICVAILSRFKNESSLFEQWDVDTRLDGISMQYDVMIDFLAEHLTGQKAVEFAISDVVLPFMTFLEGSTASFSLVYIICKRCITVGSELISSKSMEDLAKSLSDRFAREMTYVSADIWTLIGVTDFAFPLLHVADLVLLLLSYCTEKALPSGFLRCAERYGFTSVGIAMDWMLAPSDVHSHMLRISQLFSVSLQIVLATGVAEENLLEWMQSKLLNNELLFSKICALECFVRILLLTAYPPIQSFNKICPQLFVISIALLQKHIQIKRNVSSDNEYYIRKICSTLQHAMSNAQFDKSLLFSKLNHLVLHLLQTLAEITVSCNCFRIFLAFYFNLASTNLTPSDIRNVFATVRSARYLQVALTEVLLELLLSEKVEPKDVYVFPQKIHAHVRFNCDRTARNNLTFDGNNWTGKSAPSWNASLCEERVEEVHSAQLLSGSLSSLAISKLEGDLFDRCCAAKLALDWSSCLTDGLTVSFWLLPQQCQKKELVDALDQIHPVCSMATNNLSFLLQLSSDDRTLYMRCLRSVLTVDAWNHIVVSMVAVNSLHSVHVWINSRHFILRMKQKCTKSLEKLSFVFGFGALQKDLAYSKVYELSSILSFRGPLKTSQVLILRALGCDCISLAACNISSLMLKLTSLLSSQNVSFQQNAILDLLADVGTAFARLQQNFLFVIRDQMAYMQRKSYSQTSQRKMELGHLPSTEKHLLEWNCPMVKRLRKISVDDCWLSLGSQNLFLFMFAEAIDLKHNAYEQAITFRLLFQFLRRVSPFINEYTFSNVYNCVIRCLSSSLAYFGAQMLKEFRSACISLPSNIKCSNERSKQWFIVDPELIVRLVCAPLIWKGREKMLQWRIILEDIAHCISEERAEYSAFSREQLKRVSFLKRIFQAILEMLEDNKDYRIEVQDVAPLTDALLTIIHVLLDSLSVADGIMLLWNFIFLSHAAAHAYITYGHNDHFHWLQQELLQEECKLNLLEDTDLVRRLKDYGSILGRSRIVEVWTKERSVVKLRQMYEAACLDDSNSEHYAFSKRPSTVHGKDALDLVCDLQRAKSELNVSNEDFITEKERLIDWFCDLRCRCLEQLAVIVQNAPDASFNEAVNMKISWQAVVVLLTNQSDERFRNNVFNLLEQILLRADSEVRLDFIRKNGFELLSSQMKGYPVTDEIASSLFSLLFEEAVRFNVELGSDHVSSLKVNQFKCLSLKAIFVLWEESVHHSSLHIYWNISSMLMALFNENEVLMQAMMDIGLCTTVVSILRRIASLPPRATDLIHVSATAPFMECWFGIVRRIIRLCLPYRNSHLYSMCQEMLWLLEMAVLNTDTQSERITRQGFTCVCGLWLTVLQESYLNDDKSDWDSMNDLLAADQESADDTADNGIQCTTSPVSNFLSETLSAVLGTVVDFRDCRKCPYKNTYSKRLPSTDECAERLIFCVTEISQFFTSMPMKSLEAVTNQEVKLFQIFLSFLSLVCNRDDTRAITFVHLNKKQRLINACHERVGHLFGPLIAFILFPASAKANKWNCTKPNTGGNENSWEMKKRMMIVETLMSNRKHLKFFLGANLEYHCALNLSLHELALLETVEDLNIQRDIENLIRFLRKLQIESPLATLDADRFTSLNVDESLAVHGYLEYRNKFLAKLQQRAARYIAKEKQQIRIRSEIAMQITCRVVEDQNSLRRNFMKTYQESELKNVAAELFLDNLLTELCHAEGLFHDPKSWPSSWALDPTEGPNRERRRLISSHLSFDIKFLRPQSINKIKKREESPPLFHLLNDLRGNMNELSLEDGLVPGERIILSLPAVIVRSTVESSGEILAGDKKFYFHSDYTRSVQKRLNRANTLFVRWSYRDLVEIYKRHHLLKDIALEIFLSDGQTYLIVFEEQAKRDQFGLQILSSELCKLSDFSDVSVQSTAQLWREGTITNFEYLMHLNKLAGRSYNDLMQYPVFPFVLSDYKSSVLNLKNPVSFRDLSRPMAVQDKRLEEYYLRKYSYLAREEVQASPGCSPFMFGPYHYGSHYSNIGIVAHYLVRLPPFTDIALEYQDNNFDIADRLFNSIETTWRLASFDSTTDFKELIPEFFYLPDFLMNKEKLNLGVRQNGDIVDDVILPTWCQGSARLFVLIHRQALESSVVSSTLNYWIDLIFGYKQTGKAAIDAINVFHPATYRMNTMNGINDESDDLSTSALRAMIQTYGQMPLQLFHSPHLPRLYGKLHQNTSKSSLSPLDTVKGIRWGEFVGSPDSELGKLVVVLNQKLRYNNNCSGRLVAFSEGTCFAFPSNTCFVYKYGEVRIRDLCSYGLVTWRYNDGILRLRLHQPKLWWDLASYNTYNVVTAAYCVSFDLLFVGLSCGIILTYRILLNEFGVKDFVLLKTLYAHDAAVQALAVCGDFAVMASGCDMGKICIWDLNRLSYIRTLVPSNGKEVQFICISRTSCDVAIVAYSGYGSHVTLQTINGLEIGSIDTDIVVTAVAMTSLSEGTAVNCIFLGMQNGVIRIFDMWTMRFVRDIVDYRFLEPIVSISFSNRCTRLFVNFVSGRVLCWQGENLQSKRPPSLRIIDDV